MRRSIPVLVLLFTALVIYVPAAAQTRGQVADSRSGLSVSPAIFEMPVEPGESRNYEFYVTNIKDEPVPLRASVKRLTPVEEEIDLSLRESFDASTWIKISEPDHILDGKERRRLEAAVTVPENTEPGGHYATIVLEPLVPATLNSDSGAKVAAQVGVIVFITVKGEAVTEVSFAGSPGVSRLQTKKEVPITAAVVNTGTIHVLPTSSITIRGLFGRVKAELPVKPRIVLPNTIKKFSTTWENPGVFGVYSAEAEGTYGPGQSVITSGKKYFLVIRWLPLSLILAVLSVVAVFTLKTYRRWPAAFRAFKGKLPGSKRIEEENLL